MKRVSTLRQIGALVVFAAVAFSPLVARADYFTGTWSFKGTLGHPVIETMTGVCVISVASNGAVVGSCRGPYGVAKAEGVTNGTTILLRVHHVAMRPGGVSGIAALKGLWYRTGVIRGTWTDSPFPGAGGTFVGVPVK